MRSNIESLGVLFSLKFQYLYSLTLGGGGRVPKLLLYLRVHRNIVLKNWNNRTIFVLKIIIRKKQ